jgi:hypothetical protein
MKKIRIIILAAILALNQAVLFSESASAATFVCGASGTYTVSDQGVLGNGSNCSGAVVLDPSVTRINYATGFAETGSGITSLTIPATTTTISVNQPFMFQTKNNTEFIVDSSNPNYSSQDGVLYNKNKTTLIAYPQGKSGTSYTVESSVTQVTAFAFICPKFLQTINFGTNVADLSSSAFGYNGYCWSGSVTREIVVSGDNPNYSTSDGVLFNKSVTNLMFYPYAKTNTSYVVPNSVTSITKISLNPYLTNITLPNGLTRIDSYAFEGSALTSVTIPDSVNNYGNYSFYSSKNLQSITVGEGNSSLKSLDGVVYSKDGTRLREYPGGKDATSFVIPDGVTSTDLQWISSAKNLNYITVPASVTTIASGYTSNYSKPESYLIFQGNSKLISISGNYAKNIIYCGTPNAAITGFATLNSTTPRCPTETQLPDFTLSSNVISGIRNTALVGYSITATVAPDSYSITPSISNGLTFNASTGLITGTPTSTSASRTYTIVGTNWLGSVSRQVTLDIQASAPVTSAPGTPTIGSAVALSSTSASVTFSAPASNGGATIETYTATSTPGSIMARLTQAGSGTIIVTGLSSSTAYTFRVTASNRIGTSSSSSATVSITTPASEAELAAQAAAATRAQEAQAAAALAAEVVKREAEKKTARSEIENKFKNSENVDLQTFTTAGIAGVNERNFKAIQAEIQSLPQESRGDITQVIKIARKFEVVDLLASETVSNVSSNVLVEVGLIPVESKNKSTLTNVVRKLPQESRNSYEDVKAAINSAIAEIQNRKDRLADVISRISSRSKG